MPAVTVQARSLPYRPTLTRKDRICNRCGIQFRVGHGTRDAHINHCRDCRGMT